MEVHLTWITSVLPLCPEVPWLMATSYRGSYMKKYFLSYVIIMDNKTSTPDMPPHSDGWGMAITSFKPDLYSLPMTALMYSICCYVTQQLLGPKLGQYCASRCPSILQGKAVSRQSSDYKVSTVRCRYNRANFIKNIHERHHVARPLGRGTGCHLCIQPQFIILPQFLQWCMHYLDLLDCLITALNCIIFLNHFSISMILKTFSLISWHSRWQTRCLKLLQHLEC